MTQQRKKCGKGGFTLVELVVTLVILSILFAIAVPNLLGYIHLSQFRKNESYARTMYLSAESELTYLRTGGEWETFKSKVMKEGKQYTAYSDSDHEVYGIRLNAGEYSEGDLSGDGKLVDELLSVDTYDKSVLNAAICIEIDVTSGQVYSAFYGTACDGLYYGSNATSKPTDASGTWLDMDQRKPEIRREERLGYYSVKDAVNVVSLDATKLGISSIKFINGESLTLDWWTNSKHFDREAKYAIKIYNNETNALLLSMELARQDDNVYDTCARLNVTKQDGTEAVYTFPLSYDQATKHFSLVLDGMMDAKAYDQLDKASGDEKAILEQYGDTSIRRFGGDLLTQQEIRATVQALPNSDEEEYQKSEELRSTNTANTLFAGEQKFDNDVYQIEKFRHLSNIRYTGEDTGAKFEIQNSLDWTDGGVRIYRTISFDTVDVLNGKDTVFPSIPELKDTQTLKSTNGLFGNTISNLKLDNDSVAGDAKYLGLFQKNSGTITGLRLLNPQVEINSSTLAGVGAICGYSSGTLQNSAVDGTEAKVDATLTSADAKGIGGVAGVIEVSNSKSVTKLSASGTVTGTLPTSGTACGIGGVAGSLTTNGATVKTLTNSAAVTGNRSVGGIAGYFSGKNLKTGKDVADCQNDGLVLSSTAAAEDSLAGHYIGGIVGYANNASLSECKSRAGYADGYTYTQADKDKLRGKYVGGIVGYGVQSVLYDCETEANGYVLGGEYVGGIIGALTQSDTQTALLSDSGTKATVNASYVIGNSYVGGIIGENKGNSTIKNCVNTGVVAGYNAYIGGICGANAEKAAIENCASYVSDTNNAIYKRVTDWGAVGSYAGGLTGYNNGKITFEKDNKVISTRSVAGIVVGKHYVGGLVGYNDTDGTIDVAYTLIGGRVAATGDCVGGLVGLNASTKLLEQDLTIKPSSVQGRYYVGGAIGANVVNLSEDITIDGLTVNNSLGTITAEAYCGGLIGYQRTYTDTNLGGMKLQQALSTKGVLLPGIEENDSNVPGTVKASTNTHTITITAKGNDKNDLSKVSNNMTIRAYAYAGGIIGYCESQTRMKVENCLNAGGFDRPADGTFSNSKLKSGVDMVSYLQAQKFTEAANALSDELGTSELRVSIIGGVVGVNGESHTIDHCASKGTMNGLNAMGGVVGLNEGTITKCTLSGSMGSATQDYIGGIAGLNVGSNKAGTIENCTTAKNCTVTGRNTVGGIVGYNLGGGRVQNNTSSANVSGTGRVGGIAGENGGTITLSSTQAETRRVNGSGMGVGGVIGVNTATGKLEAATGTSGDVIAADSKLTVRGNSMVGGIVGINRGKLGGSSSSYLTNQAAEVRATTGNAGGVVGAQQGTKAVLRYAKNLGQVTANTGAAGGIAGLNQKENTVENCIGNGSVTSNDGYAGGVVSENYGTIKDCSVGTDSTKVTFITRNKSASGAICAINHADGTVQGAKLGEKITISGSAFILGAVVGDNYGTVTETEVSQQPTYDVSASTLQVGGAVGINRAGGTVSKVKVNSNFEKFTKYTYLGGVVGQNSAKASDGTAAGKVTGCTYSGTIAESKSAVGNCYGGIAGLNAGLLQGNTVSKLTLTADGVYTATSTSSASDKERLSSHIGGIAGKNDTTGEIQQCYIDNSSTGAITVKNGMVGGVTGYNKGTITMSGDKSTETLMANVSKVSDLLSNAKKQNLSADSTWVKWEEKRYTETNVEDMQYSNGTALNYGRTMQIIVSSNGNLGGVAGYNAPTGEMDRCVSGNWLLVNKSDGIGVGTGGIVGMNESEKDLSYLLNRAFVGRQLKDGNTNRFAGGIIGTQTNKTSNGWTIDGCVNYGTIYAYNSHYAGGIIGQWTQNGGTIEGCYNYGNLQTTYSDSWVGASGGIVAQLYHASSEQDFNIISCQNHGSIYGRGGDNVANSANDSAGILGNVTTYKADSESNAQKFTINVADCVNGPGVKIYSASMASGIVGFFSSDNASADNLKKSTWNIVLNIDRCRNYAQTLKANSYRGGIFGDRYGNAKDSTYIQNCFSVLGEDNSEPKNAIVSLTTSNSTRLNEKNAGNNYYFSQAWGMSTTSSSAKVGINGGEYDSCRGGSRKLLFADLNNQILAVRGGPEFADKFDESVEFPKYKDLTNSNTEIQPNGDLVSDYNNSRTITGHKLFSIDKSGVYANFFGMYQSYDDNFRKALRTANGALNDMDTYVRTYYREFEYDAITTDSGKKLNNDFGVKLTPEQDGSFNVAITDDSRPLYYEGEVEVNGETVLTNLRFIPNQKGQGLWNSTFTGVNDNSGYGKGVTTGTFQLPESLASSTAGKTVTIKVRAVSLFEDTDPSDVVSDSTNNVAVLPQPDVSIRLYKVQTEGWGTKGEYKVSLNNYNAFAAFTNWKVTLKLGSQTKVIDSNNPTVIMDGENIKELIVTATADATNDIKPAAVTQTIPTDTPSSPYTPDGSIKSLDVAYSGSTVDDFTITASLAVNQSTMDTPPIYRVEVLGTVDNQQYVFAYEDVLTSAGNAVTANFRDLPEEYFSDTVKNRQVRAWYAASGLGPVYTYGDTEMAVYHNANGDYHAEKALTYRTYVDGEPEDKTVYSFVVGQEQWNHFDGYITTTSLDIKPLTAPELNEPELLRDGDGSISYKFSWTQPDEGTEVPKYSVKLTGINTKTDSDGKVTELRVGIPTSEVYTDSTKMEFTINADDWQYAEVELTVTRLGQSSGEVGLSATARYPVKQRLERPGQPSVTNPDTNELEYNIGWSAISSETGCAGYQIYVQPEGETAVELGEQVPANGGSYSVSRSLEDYAGKTIDIYLVAVAAVDSGYANSPNGIVYTMTVPERLATPSVEWSYNWNETTLNPIAAASFKSGGLTVKVTPVPNTNSEPPGGSTYLLRATITTADGTTETYPVSAMSASGGSYVYNLTDLDTKYAGCTVQFEARISQSAGQVSSAWVGSGSVTFPRVTLETPSASLANVTEKISVTYGPADLMIYHNDWDAQFTTLSWNEVENANKYTINLTDKDNNSTAVTVDMSGNSPKITVTGQNTVAVTNGDWYNVKQGSMFTGNYSLTNGRIRYYSYQLNTMLQVDHGTFTLKLPNIFSMVTHENQTLQLSDVQIKSVAITADSTSNRYAASAATEREFS